MRKNKELPEALANLTRALRSGSRELRHNGDVRQVLIELEGMRKDDHISQRRLRRLVAHVSRIVAEVLLKGDKKAER